MEILEPSKSSTQFACSTVCVSFFEDDAWWFEDEFEVLHGPYGTTEDALEAYLAYWLDGRYL